MSAPTADVLVTGRSHEELANALPRGVGIRHLEPATPAWLLAGGIAYTGGTPFYHNERLRHAHALWDLFVIAGSVCHAVAVGTLLQP